MAVAIRLGAWLTKSSGPPPNPTGDASVMGLVVDENGSPVDGAALVLTLLQDGTRPRWPLTSDADGRFALSDLPRGTFTLRASKLGHVGATFSATAAVWGHTPIDLQSVPPRAEIRVLLTRASEITGLAQDAQGRPLGGYYVSIARVEHGREITPFGTHMTSVAENGRYRLTELPSGDYCVRLGRGADDNFRLYYPSALNPSGCALVAVDRGARVSGIDLQVPVVPTTTIEGAIAKRDGLTFPMKVEVFDAAAHPMTNDPRTTETDREGRFRLKGVPAGKYLVVAQTTTPPSSSERNTPAALTQHSDAVAVQTDGKTPVRVTMNLTPGVQVSGTVSRDGRPVTNALIHFIAADTETGARMGSFRAVDYSRGDGTFAISHVPVGRYIVTSSPEQVVMSLETAGVVNTTDYLDVGATNLDIKIDVARHTGELRGVVRNGAGAATAAAVIVAFPVEATPETRARLFHTTRPATSGRYVLTHLPPGDVIVAAAADLPRDAWRDPAVLNRLRAAGTRIAVTGAPLTLDLIVK